MSVSVSSRESVFVNFCAIVYVNMIECAVTSEKFCKCLCVCVCERQWMGMFFVSVLITLIEIVCM